MWGQICLYNGIPDFELQFGLWILSFGHEQPLIFIRPVKSSQRRYKTSTWSPALDRGKRDI
jgi:hypothetical protein